MVDLTVARTLTLALRRGADRPAVVFGDRVLTHAALDELANRLAHVLLGRLRGGLALTTIAGCAGFGALTGSSLATAATIAGLAPR